MNDLQKKKNFTNFIVEITSAELIYRSTITLHKLFKYKI